MSIESNIEEVRARIRAACERCGRDPEDVTLIAVTKLHEAEEMNEVLTAALRILPKTRCRRFCGSMMT